MDGSTTRTGTNTGANIASGSLDARPLVSDSSCLDPSGFNRLSHGSISAGVDKGSRNLVPRLSQGRGVAGNACVTLLLVVVVAAVAAAADADAGDLTICDAVADASAGSTTNMSDAIAGAIAGAGAGAGAGAADVWTGCLC